MGMDSSATDLYWFDAFQPKGEFDSVGFVAIPDYVYKALMLFWSIWMVIATIKWIRVIIQVFRLQMFKGSKPSKN